MTIEDRAQRMFEDYEAWQGRPFTGDDELSEIFMRHLRAQVEDCAGVIAEEIKRLADLRTSCEPHSDEAVRLTACMVTAGKIARDSRDLAGISSQNDPKCKE